MAWTCSRVLLPLQGINKRQAAAQAKKANKKRKAE